MDLDHGQKQLACTAGLLWYLAADDQTQFAYRTWAQGVADGQATMDEPPAMVRAALEERARKATAARRQKATRRR
jgi:hypothetical protein